MDMDDSTNQQQNPSLPALFATPSLTDVSTINRTSSTPFRFQFESEPSAEQNQAKSIIEQIAKSHDFQLEQINKMQTLQKQLLNSGQAISEDLINQQYMLNEQINNELKQLLGLNRTIILGPAELHLSRILGQRLQIQQQGLDLLMRELAQNNSANPVDTFVKFFICYSTK